MAHPFQRPVADIGPIAARRSQAGRQKPLPPSGQIVATPGVLEVTGRRYRFLCQTGVFGTVCAEDAALNRDAIRIGDRILSAYPIDPAKPAKGYGENCFWIITEYDRSATTFLLPSEY